MKTNTQNIDSLLKFTPSTLLIPTLYIHFFKMRKRQFQSLNNYFTYLLLTYIKKFNPTRIEQINSKWKMQYQAQGLELQKMSFVPNPNTWEAWRQLSSYHGYSICNLFVLIMELDYKSWLDSGCPSTPPKLPHQSSYRKTDTFLPQKRKKNKYISLSYQKIDFEKNILMRGGKFQFE